MDENVRQERARILEELEAKRRAADQHRSEIDSFLRQRAALRAEEQRRDAEEKRKMDEFRADLDERLERAQEEQKRRDRLKQQVAAGIGREIARQRREREEYEQLCVDLAVQEELEKLKQREIAEAEKLRRQYEEARQFMVAAEEAKRERIRMSKREEERLKQELIEQQKRLAQLAEIEQEQNRIRLEQYRRELAKQMIERKQMYEAARQAELERIQREKEREARRQALIEEERRNLVVAHIIAMGPDSVKYFPKGVLKESDLDYLPQEFREAILGSGNLKKFYDSE